MPLPKSPEADTQVGHTPGRWYVGDFATGSVKSDSSRCAGHLVASVFGGREDCTRDGEMDANCHLISAAPAMLEALENTFAALRTLIKDPDSWATVQAARAAIKQARGET